MPDSIMLLVFALAWLGHVCLWTSLLSNLFGRTIPKPILKAWRALTAGVIVAFPVLLLERENDVIWWYLWPCVGVGGIVFPAITVLRLLRKQAACILSESTVTLDLWRELGSKLIGDGKLTTVAKLPGNGLFRVDITDFTLALPELPPAWEGLTILILSDLHFHGTPAQLFFDRIVDELLAGPTPDLVCLIGDYVDTDTHHTWIQSVLGRLKGTEAKFAILGNHDRHHNPERVRAALTEAGYAVLGNDWKVVTIRGVPCVAVGHEGPWFAPPPKLTTTPPGMFRLCLSHTPDNFYWGVANAISLMLCGHVHGGAIRLPVIGSIFVPSVYGRRFDYGIFEERGTMMVVNRGVSGKEPIRFRCNPQVMRVKLVRQPK